MEEMVGAEEISEGAGEEGYGLVFVAEAVEQGVMWVLVTGWGWGWVDV